MNAIITKDNYKQLCKHGWGWDEYKTDKRECWLYAILHDRCFPYKVFLDDDSCESYFKNFEEIEDEAPYPMPPWKNKWARYRAVDKDGYLYEYRNKPHFNCVASEFMNQPEYRGEFEEKIGEGYEYTGKIEEREIDTWTKENLVTHLAGLKFWVKGQASPHTSPMYQDLRTDSGLTLTIELLKSGGFVFSPYYSKPYEEWLTAEQILEQSK